MFPIADQTAGPIGLNFFMDTHGWPWGVLGFKKNRKKMFFPFFSNFFSSDNAGPFS